MIVLDSDVLVDLLDGDEATTALLERLVEEREDLATTTVNAAELVRGAGGPGRDREMVAETHELLSRLVELPLDVRAARRFGAVMAALDRAGKAMPVVDGLVAAIALENGGRIATRNRRHYARVPGLDVTTP